MSVHQLWKFPRGTECSEAMQIVKNHLMGQLSSEQLAQLHDSIWSYHSHFVGADKCFSIVMQRIQAPIHVVWSSVRRFDKPQAYKPFIRSCSMSGDGQVGSTRVLELVSGLPAASSMERLEIFDDERHILSFKILGGQHRLNNYCSTTTLHECSVDGQLATLVMESYVVDIPAGNSREETRLFADTIVKYNLQTLAHISEMEGRHQSVEETSS
ncbi:hypothetical protein GOP47_0012044 [Adiantum capillus-veneris]|uniref:Uncharacterized protein n=1 Tax=Adiantum capillus-veneris TaxID=13818 RepID=A0A9D4UTZ7_ADICA|nr:hypothetical protein GOP47_0012044 [Adiantum capillus-veneris]